MKTTKDYLNNAQKDYQFTKEGLEEDCLEFASGGFLDKKNQEVYYTPDVNGDNNVVLSFGDISNSDGASNNKKVDPMEVLSLLFGK